MDNDPKSTALYQNLDTTFVNIWSLLRNLTERGFIGRVRVELPDYAADVFMNGSTTPVVREFDHAAGTETLEQGALHRLVLRARETPGTISVFEGDHEANATPAATIPVETSPEVTTTTASPAPSTADDATVIPDKSEPKLTSPEADPFRLPDRSELLSEDIYRTGSYQDWAAILATSGALIAAVERAINANGEDFGNTFNRVRLQLADDYSFLDPMSRAFEYSAGVASLNGDVPLNVYISGLSEALRRCVARVASGDRERRVRERVALEMLPVVRTYADSLERSGFQSQLDRIAGTRVM